MRIIRPTKAAKGATASLPPDLREIWEKVLRLERSIEHVREWPRTLMYLLGLILVFVIIRMPHPAAHGFTLNEVLMIGGGWSIVIIFARKARRMRDRAEQQLRDSITEVERIKRSDEWKQITDILYHAGTEKPLRA